MREIEFRAYCKSMKRMLSFEHLKNATKGMVNIANQKLKEISNKSNISNTQFKINKLCPNGLFLPLEDDDLEFMQYTGLTDKNGNKIFEGDIIKARHIEDLYIVKWEDCSFVIEDEWGGTIRRHQDSINRLECEVIGNIWDNPEMIKENEDG